MPALTASILDLAATLNLRPVVEGIETPAQLDRLRELHCELGQGFLFARPLTAGQLETFATCPAGAPAQPAGA